MAGLNRRQQESLDKKVAHIKSKSEEATFLSKEIKSRHTQYKNIIDQLENIKAQATKLTKEYKKTERQIEIKLNKAEKFYDTTFQSLKGKIDNKQLGLRKAIQDAGSFLKNIESEKAKIKASSDIHSSNLKELNLILTKARRADKSTTTSSNSAAKSRAKIEGLLDEAKTVYAKIKDSNTQAGLLKAKTNDFLNSAKRIHSEIDAIRSNALKMKGEMEAFESEASSTNDKITKLYEIVTNKSMAGAFDERRGKLSKQLDGWNRKVRFWSVCLFIAVVGLLTFQLYLNEWKLHDLGYDFYLRALFAGPIVYYLVFCVTQFNHVRKSHEKYSFKTTIALSIEAHTDLLTKSFVEDKYRDQILKFSLESLNKIYDKPYHDELAMALIENEKNGVESETEKQSVSEVLLTKDSEYLKLFKSALQLVKGNVVS